MGEGRGFGLGVAIRGRVLWFALLGVLSGAVAVAPFGCGLDDNAIEQLENVDGSIIDGAALAEGGKPIGDGGADVVVVACTPKTCTSYPSVCRSGLPDGCDDAGITCGCAGGYACITDSGTCDGPPVCLDAGAPNGSCGTITNPGNGLTAACGNCTNTGYTCNGNACTCAAGGTVCGTVCCSGANPNCNTATPNTCCKQKNPATDCGGSCSNAVPNGCGGTMDCSNSCGTQQCDPTNKTCCTAESTATACGNSCNTSVMNNCHNSTTCGATCAITNETCVGTSCACATALCGTSCCSATQVCNSNACCTPESAATTCSGNKCGVVNNNCGQPVNCGNADGSCESGEVCSGNTNCTCHTQTCNPGQGCCGPDGAHFCHSGGIPCP